MEYKSTDKPLSASLCEKCPARIGTIFIAEIRGSSFRGRLINDGEDFSVDNCIISVDDVTVANVRIANIDASAAEQDAEVITSSFEARVSDCTRPDLELAACGLMKHCSPINKAVDDFIELNY